MFPFPLLGMITNYIMTRVWVYQSSRPFDENEISLLKERIKAFTEEWSSHSQSLKAGGNILLGRFLQLKVDEDHTTASGCSIDSSVRFLQDLGFEFGTDFFDRLNFAYLDNGVVKTAHKDDFAALYQEGVITDETIVFNNLVKTEDEFKANWQIPLKNSWHKNFL